MRQIKTWCTAIVFILLTLGFVQAAGGYLAAKLSSLGDIEQQSEISIEEKIVKQQVLQLEPREYYTIQIGSYTDAISGQKRIDALAKAGYRVMVSKEPPYRLWLGCMGVSPSLEQLPDEIVSDTSDVFVEKQIMNQQNLEFFGENLAQWQEIASLVASLDVVLGHSLQLFQDYRYESCSRENWNGMIAQVQEELAIIAMSSEPVLQNLDDEHLADLLLELLICANRYRESLTLIVEQEHTRMVLLAQSCLLELITCYHDFIAQSTKTPNE